MSYDFIFGHVKAAKYMRVKLELSVLILLISVCLTACSESAGDMADTSAGTEALNRLMESGTDKNETGADGILRAEKSFYAENDKNYRLTISADIIKDTTKKTVSKSMEARLNTQEP